MERICMVLLYPWVHRTYQVEVYQRISYILAAVKLEGVHCSTLGHGVVILLIYVLVNPLENLVFRAHQYHTLNALMELDRRIFQMVL